VTLDDCLARVEADLSGLANSPPKEGEKSPRRNRGRPQARDSRNDKRIYEAWKSGNYKDYADLARDLHETKDGVARAIDAHRQRMNRSHRAK
jgi:hypothetical protein